VVLDLKGSGLGCWQLEAYHRGNKKKNYVESEFGIGSEFSFTIEKAVKVDNCLNLLIE
jgi:two-component system phosphate regulon sensor histidine kinase PhoR